jgi:serine/threonine protein phosphatase PrpC
MSTRATKTAPVLDWASATDKGPRRDNQDRVLLVDRDEADIDRRGALLVLCDGVGGEEGGHVAAEIASAEAQRVFYSESLADTPMLLRLALDRAWLAVKNESLKSAQHARMATTCVAAAIHQGVAYIAWVGDSRAYVLRNGKLRQLTDDHSYVNQQIKLGVITPDEAKRSQYRGVLTRSLAAMADHTPEVVSETLQTGDRVLLCSDGLHSVVDDATIEQTFSHTREAEASARELVAIALKRKTGDNVTVAVLNYGVGVAAPVTATMRAATAPAAVAASAVPRPLEQRSSRAPLAIVGLLALLLIGGGAASFALGMLPGLRSGDQSAPTTTQPAPVAVDTQVPAPSRIETQAAAPQDRPTALPGDVPVKQTPTTAANAPAAPTSTQAAVPPTPTKRPTATPRPPTRTPTPEPTATKQTPVVTTLAIPTPAPLQSQPPNTPIPQPQNPPQDPPTQEPPKNDVPGLPGAEVVTVLP